MLELKLNHVSKRRYCTHVCQANFLESDFQTTLLCMWLRTKNTKIWPIIYYALLVTIILIHVRFMKVQIVLNVAFSTYSDHRVSIFVNWYQLKQHYI